MLYKTDEKIYGYCGSDIKRKMAHDLYAAGMFRACTTCAHFLEFYACK